MEKHKPIEAWILKIHTSFANKSKRSVDVHHPYPGEFGKKANCRVALPLSSTKPAVSLPVADRLLAGCLNKEPHAAKEGEGT